MKKEDFRLTLRDIKNDRIRRLTAVIFLQSVLRGCLARKRVQKIRERGYGQETATIFFLLQVEYWCAHLHNCQTTSLEKVEYWCTHLHDCQTTSLEKQSRSRHSSSAEEFDENEESLIEEKLANDMLEMLQSMRS